MKRYDGITLTIDGTPRTDANGRFVVAARIARTGIQSYPTGDELRTADEVFDAASMATFRGLPITIGHAAWIDAKNVNDLSVGYVRDVRRDGDHLAADLVLFAPHAIERVQDGRLKELSVGYAMRGVPDTFEGRPITRQTEIRANHLALLGAGQARCGSSCSVAA